MPLSKNGQSHSCHPHPSLPPRIPSINTYLINHGYHLSKVIGEGSYSKVRLCLYRDPVDGAETNIACKIINKRKASGDFVNKFLPRELQIVARLRHPNIISVFDLVEYDQNVFIFMEYAGNGDLLEFVKRKGYLSENRSQRYFHQILLAVRYLHSLDVAHRDLKCENVLLTKNDEVKISDFGFSRFCYDQATGKRSLSNTYCGSAAYAAPEILQGTMYNPKLYDMWSLGCILFIMLTGHMPYDESNIQQMLQNQIDRVLTYPTQVEGLISKPPKRLIRHLLEPDVTRRATVEQALANVWFPSFDSFLEDIDPEGGGGDLSKGDTGNSILDNSIEPNEQAFGEITSEDYGRQASKPPSTPLHPSSRMDRVRPFDKQVGHFNESRHISSSDGRRVASGRSTYSRQESIPTTGRSETSSRRQTITPTAPRVRGAGGMSRAPKCHRSQNHNK